MFRHLTKVIFRLNTKYLVRSYVRIIMECIKWYSREGEVGTRYLMYHGGREVWVHGVSNIIQGEHKVFP